MYYLTEINFIFIFIALTGSITVNFAGYFDFNRKWTYSYQVLKTTTEISSDVQKHGRMSMTEADKEISSEKSKIELKTTHKTRFSVTGHLKKVATKISANKNKKRQKSLRQKTPSSDGNLEISIGDVTKSILTSSSIDHDDNKPIISGKISMDTKDRKKNKKRHKGQQQDMTPISDVNLAINNQEHVAEIALNSPSIDLGVKTPTSTDQMSRSFEDYDTTTEKKKHKDLQPDLTIFSDEMFEINSQEQITENVSTSLSISRGVEKPAVTSQMSKSIEEYDTTTDKKKRHKELQHDLTTISDGNFEISSQEHITDSVSTSPSSGRGAKKTAVTIKISTSLEEYETTTEKKKRHKSLKTDVTTFSDEYFEIDNQEQITESVSASPSIGRGVKKPAVTSQMSKSIEEYDTTTEKKKLHKGQQHDMATFSDENLKTYSQEPSIGRGAKKLAVTGQISLSLEKEDNVTGNKKHHKDLQNDMPTFSDENLETNSQEYNTESILASPSIGRVAKKPATISQISKNLQGDAATTKKKNHQKEQRHDMTTSSDVYSDEEYENESELKSPSKEKDIKKAATTATTDISFEDETTTTKKKRYKKPKKTTTKIVHKQSSDSNQESDMYSVEDEISSSKNQAKSKESESLEKNLDTTTENVFNTMRPQYFHEEAMSNISLHTIEEDPQVKYFIGHILRSALRIFSIVKNKTKSPNLAAKLDLLADKYVTRYNLFIDEIKKNKIKTTLGTQKVLLSAIDSSDQMMNRIVNYIIEDGSNKDALRTSVDVANEFKRAVIKETDEKYTYICRMMDVCHAKRGFANFLNEYISIILLCNDSKFVEAVKAFTEVTKKINFAGTFDSVTRLHIIRALKYIESQDLLVMKTILMIIRNIIAYKNEPLKIIKSDRAVNSTLAIWEILEAFETKLLRSDANIIIWGDLRTNLVEWANYKRNDIHDTMNNFMFYLKTAIDDMPSFIKKRIAHNIGVIMNRKPGM